MRIFICIIFSFFLIPTLYSQHRVKWHDAKELDTKVTKGDKKYIIYFYYDGCKWCKTLEENSLSNDQIAKFINNNFYAFRINAIYEDKITIKGHTYTSVPINKYEFSELAVDLLSGNMSFPSLVFLDESFNKIQVLHEYVNPTDLEMILTYFAGDYYQNTLFRKFARSYCKDTHFNTLVKGNK